MGMIEVVKLRYSSFAEGRMGLYLVGRNYYPRLEPKTRRFYLPSKGTVFKKKDDLVYTTKANYDRLQAVIRNSIYQVELPSILGTSWEKYEDYFAFAELYPYSMERVLDENWIYKDNLICINNYINRWRDGASPYRYITLKEVRMVVEHYAKENGLSLMDASEKLKRLARESGELHILDEITKVIKGWKSIYTKSERRQSKR